MMPRTRTLDSSSSLSKGPKLPLSAGIEKFLSQAPLAKAKKSSPGLTLGSPAVRSIPMAPSSAFGPGGAAGAAVLATGDAAADTGFFSSGALDAQAARTAVIAIAESNLMGVPYGMRKTANHKAVRCALGSADLQ